MPEQNSPVGGDQPLARPVGDEPLAKSVSREQEEETPPAGEKVQTEAQPSPEEEQGSHGEEEKGFIDKIKDKLTGD